MALKTFNINEEVYKEFSKRCKDKGISMSKKIENFIKGELEGKEVRKKQKTKQVKGKRKVPVKDHSFSKYC
jgi:hypothetical protein